MPDQYTELIQTIQALQSQIASQQSNYIQLATLVITVAVAVFGWFFALHLQKKQHQLQVKHEIYRQFVTIYKDLQNSLSVFGASTQAPLILMSCELVTLEIRAKFGEDSFLPYVSEDECIHKGNIKYNDWLHHSLFKNKFEYKEHLLKFFYLIEDWAAPLASMLPTKEVLRVEIERLNEIIDTELETFQSYSQIHGEDWRLWDKEDVQKHGYIISDTTMAIGTFLHDFRVILHNELLSPYYGYYETPTRKTLDRQYKVLTKKGIVVNLDD